MSTDTAQRYVPGAVYERAALPPLENACGCLVPWGEPDARDEPVDAHTRFVANASCAACSGTGRRLHPRQSPTLANLAAVVARPFFTAAELIDRADVARLARYGASWGHRAAYPKFNASAGLA